MDEHMEEEVEGEEESGERRSRREGEMEVQLYFACSIHSLHEVGREGRERIFNLNPVKRLMRSHHDPPPPVNCSALPHWCISTHKLP